MIDPDVRAAEPADVAQLAALEEEARHALIDQRGGRRWLEEHPLIGEAWPVRLDADTVLVAFIDDVLVGYAVVVDDGPDISRVDQVFVTPGARELGFGDALLAAGVAHAASAALGSSRARPSRVTATRRTSTSEPASRRA